jgi:hypothetical protein
MEKEIKKQVKKAVLFFKKHGFMDLSRFCGYLNGLNLTPEQKIDLYIKTDFKK